MYIAQTVNSTKWDDFTFIDGHKYQKTDKSKIIVLYSNAFSNCGDATRQSLKLKAGKM